MRTRLKLDLWLPLLLVLAPLAGHAVQDLPDPQADQSGLVEIEYAPELLLPYRDRRTDWAMLLGFKYENFLPTGYSSADTGNTYTDLYGKKPTPLFGVTAGAKYNLIWGSLTAELSYSVGSVSNAVTITDDNGNATPTNESLNITKTGAHFGVWLDMMTPEPYVVPYAQVDVFRIDFVDADSGGQISGTSSPCIGFTVGALFQMNWIDSGSATSAQSSSGLNNTYIDLFLSKSNGSGQEPSFSSDVSWGAGMKLEF